KGPRRANEHIHPVPSLPDLPGHPPDILRTAHIPLKREDFPSKSADFPGQPFRRLPAAPVIDGDVKSRLGQHLHHLGTQTADATGHPGDRSFHTSTPPRFFRLPFYRIKFPEAAETRPRTGGSTLFRWLQDLFGHIQQGEKSQKNSRQQETRADRFPEGDGKDQHGKAGEGKNLHPPSPLPPAEQSGKQGERGHDLPLQDGKKGPFRHGSFLRLLHFPLIPSLTHSETADTPGKPP